MKFRTKDWYCLGKLHYIPEKIQQLFHRSVLQSHNNAVPVFLFLLIPPLLLVPIPVSLPLPLLLLLF